MQVSATSIPAPLTLVGTIVSVQGTSITARLPQASVGDLCWVSTRGGKNIAGQVVSFSNELFSLALFEEPEGIVPGAVVRTRGQQLSVPVGDFLLGRVITPLGVPLDGESWGSDGHYRSIWAKPPPASGRPPIDTAIGTGVKALDAFCTLGKGQRMGISASAGVGKSTLLAMIARQATVDVIVVALVGERGRELFIPNSDGTIVPNQDLQSKANSFNFTIVATDVKGVKELLLDNRATIVNIMNQALNSKGRSNLV